MKILSWNIQSGLGCDGVRDLYRIIQYIKKAGSPEIICLQEVSRNIDEYSVSGQEDQLDLLRKLLPEYEAYWGSGLRWINKDGVVEEFGNVTFTRAPVCLNKTHMLPQPAARGAYQTSRVGIEIVLPYAASYLRIINTHLAYHLETERCLQLDYLHQYQQWATDACVNNAKIGDGAYAHHLPTPLTIICGDCNLTPTSKEYVSFTKRGWRDCWVEAYPDLPHPPTCGIFDTISWPEGAHCRDYFWINEGFPWRVCNVTVDQNANYSDHQPLILSLE